MSSTSSSNDSVEIIIQQSQSWVDRIYDSLVQLLIESHMALALILAIALTHVIKILTPTISDRFTHKYPVWHGYWYTVSIICGLLASLAFIKDNWSLAIVVIFTNGLILDVLPKIPPQTITSAFKTATDRSFDPKSQD